MRPPILSPALPLLAAVAWATRLLVGPGPWAPASTTVMAAELVLLAAVSVIGMVIGHARWARRTALVAVVATFALAAALPLDLLWYVAVVVSGSAVAGLLGPWLKGWIRGRPSADGPPPGAVVLLLALLALPLPLAAASPDGIRAGSWTLIGVSLVGALWYSRAGAGALLFVRFGVPAAALTATVSTPRWTAVTAAVLGAAMATLAWSRPAGAAVRPASGHAIPIPPELVPEDILERAGLDEHGRRRGDR